MSELPQELISEEIDLVTRLLGKLEPGFLPYSIFTQITRLTTLTTIELVALLDQSDSQIKVFLLQRSDNDDFWPGLWHVPGSVLLPTDTKDSYKDPLRRIITGDLNEVPLLVPPAYFRNHFRQEARGTMHAVQHWVLLKDVPTVGQLFPVDSLPEQIVPEHIETISIARNEYLKYYRGLIEF